MGKTDPVATETTDTDLATVVVERFDKVKRTNDARCLTIPIAV